MGGTTSEPSHLDKFGGVSLMLSGALFLVKAMLDWRAGMPPSNGAEILEWTSSHQALLAWTNEVLFFATGMLVPGAFALYETLGAKHPRSASVGCGMLALTIPLLAALDIVHGRLVFPVFGLSIRSPDVAELVVALYQGGIHAVLLLFTIATIALSVAMLRAGFGRGVAALGFVTAALDVAGSYPWLIGPVPTLICGVFFAGWLVVVGARLYRRS